MVTPHTVLFLWTYGDGICQSLQRNPRLTVHRVGFPEVTVVSVDFLGDGVLFDVVVDQPRQVLIHHRHVQNSLLALFLQQPHTARFIRPVSSLTRLGSYVL